MGQKVARLGDPVATGHGCTPVTAIQGPCSSNVKINGIKAARQTDILVPHTIGTPPFCAGHPPAVNLGSTTVKVNGLPIARFGDSADLGTITNGSTNVFAG